IRHLSSSATCPRYDQEPESVYHCFFGCTAAKDVWALFDPVFPCPPPSQPLCMVLRHMMKGRECLFAAGLWWIWRNRCNVIFNQDKIWTAQQVSFLSPNSAYEFSGSIVRYTSLHFEVDLNWLPPPQGSCKINCDTSVMPNLGLAGFGCIIRNDLGILLKLVLAISRFGKFTDVNCLRFGGVLCWLGNVE
ncbi:hypothetical protein PIB30_086810, partial [Stylosanthes scabra]|nr:hypothetical protein [Stylosanthes scabra]